MQDFLFGGTLSVCISSRFQTIKMVSNNFYVVLFDKRHCIFSNPSYNAQKSSQKRLRHNAEGNMNNDLWPNAFAKSDR